MARQRQSRRMIAYHEAGHLTAAHLLNLCVSFATIEPKRPGLAGWVDHAEDLEVYRTDLWSYRQRKEMARRHILCDYAGFAAERLAGSRAKWNQGARSDYVRARGLAKRFGLNAALLRRHAAVLVLRHRGLVAAYADALLAAGSMTAQDIVQVATTSGVDAFSED